jgi:hypothetical protein
MCYTAMRGRGFYFKPEMKHSFPYGKAIYHLNKKGRQVRLLTEIFGGMIGLTGEIGMTEDARYASMDASVRARFGSLMKTEP